MIEKDGSSLAVSGDTDLRLDSFKSVGLPGDEFA
jgi:hypothetical protein